MPCNDFRTFDLIADASKTLVDAIPHPENELIVARKKSDHLRSVGLSKSARNSYKMAPGPIELTANLSASCSSSSSSSCYDRPRANDSTNSSSSLILILERPEHQADESTKRCEKATAETLSSNEEKDRSDESSGRPEDAPSRGLSVKATTSSIENLAKKKASSSIATRCRRKRSGHASPRNNCQNSSAIVVEGKNRNGSFEATTSTSSSSSHGHETATGFVATSTLTKSADCNALAISRNESRAAAKWRLQSSAEAKNRRDIVEGDFEAARRTGLNWQPSTTTTTISVAAIRGTNVALESLRDEDEAARRLGCGNYYSSAPSLNERNDRRERSEEAPTNGELSRSGAIRPLVNSSALSASPRAAALLPRKSKTTFETLKTNVEESSTSPYVLPSPPRRRRPRDSSSSTTTLSSLRYVDDSLKSSSSFTAPRAIRKNRNCRVLTSLHASLGQLPINTSSCATSATATTLGEAPTSLDNLRASINPDHEIRDNDETTFVPVKAYSSNVSSPVEVKSSPARGKSSLERLESNLTSNCSTAYVNKNPLRVLALPEVSHSPNNVANTFRNNLAASGYGNNVNNHNNKNNGRSCSHLGGTCACSGTTTSSQNSSTLTRTSNHLVNGVVPTSSWTNNSVEQETDYVVDPVQGNAYHKGQFLGKGGFARVYLMTDVENGNQYACKIIPKNRMQKIHIQKIAREIMIHKELNHVNVVQMHHYFEDNINVYMLLEPCPRKSLMHVLKYRGKVTEPEARYYMRQMVTGVAYIHSQKVVHRDLKPGNMFLSDGMIVKIGDFGLATRPDGQRRRVTICGTPNYIAPEVLYKQAYSYEADVWALGCILYALLAGQPPFDTSTLKETYARICNNRYKKLDDSVVSRSGQDLIRWLLQPIPELRPSLERVKEHAYLTMEYVPTRLSHTCCYRVPATSNSSITDQKGAATIRPHQIVAPAGNNNNNAAISRGIVNRNVNEVGHVASPPAPTASPLVGNTIPKNRTNNLTMSHLDKVVESQKKPKVGNWLLRKLPKLPRFRQRLTKLLCPEAKKPDSLMMHRAIESCLAEIRCTRAQHNPILVDRITPLFVTKWIDYSNKYGLGFQLSDRSVGVLFNDSTKMSYTHDRRRVEYATTEDEVTRYRRENDVPTSMEEKLELLRHFTHYMDNFLTNGGEIRETRANATKFARTGSSGTGNVPRMRRWLRTDKAIVMELTVPLLQVNFFVDHSKIVVSEGQRGRGYLVTYIDASRQAASYWLNDLRDVGCTTDLYERLHYVSKVIGELENDAIFETATNLVQHRNKTLKT